MRQLNTLIRSLREALPSHFTLKTVVFTLICFFSSDLGQYGSTAVLVRIFKSEQAAGLTDQQKQEIAGVIQRLFETKAVKDQISDVYRELERDEAIKGVGASQSCEARPTNIVPRSQFELPEGAAIEFIEEEKRSITKIQPVTLVSPVLIPSKRLWKFRANDIEFGARVADTQFQDNFVSGKLRIPMKSGIQMIVEMKTDETKIDGVWQVTNRTVLRVLKVPKQPLQDHLDF